MIERRRHPDGTNHDIDRGPGPVGRAPRHAPMGGVLIAQAIPGMKLGLLPQSASQAARKREWRKAHKA